MKSVEFYRECGFEDIGYMPPPLTSEEEYPYYIAQEVKEKAREIQKHQNEHTLTFAFMTDIHYASTHNHRVRTARMFRAYRELAKIVGIDKLILGGDYTNEGCKEYKENTYRELRAIIGEQDYYPAHGNHDDGTIWDTAYIKNDKSVNHLTHTELYRLFYNHLPKLGAKFDEKNPSLYYCCDDKHTKTRYVFLDVVDVPLIYDEKGLLKHIPFHMYAMSQEQIDWLCNTALNFGEEGWSVLFTAHSATLPNEVENPRPLFKNLELLRKIILSYNKGEDICTEFGEGDFYRKAEANFSSRTRADVIGLFVGDWHYDGVYRYEDMPLILTGNAVMYDKDPHAEKRTDGTKDELLFDVITIDKEKRKIFTTRIGAGKNREISY